MKTRKLTFERFIEIKNESLNEKTRKNESIEHLNTRIIEKIYNIEDFTEIQKGDKVKVIYKVKENIGSKQWQKWVYIVRTDVGHISNITDKSLMLHKHRIPLEKVLGVIIND